MKILAVDIGTGTQDILLFDSRLDVENSLKLVLPSPTLILRRQLQRASQYKQSVALHGVMMGGGPITWGVEDHLRKGLEVYATPEAAKTFNDDLEVARNMGVVLISDDEMRQLPDTIRRIELADFLFHPITNAFHEFGVDLDDLSLLAVAVFDHGEAPPAVSDRKFRFDYLKKQIAETNRLSGFAYSAGSIPDFLTRFKAVMETTKNLPFPLVVMDTAPAAVLGASLDPEIANRPDVLITNIGNLHTLAFRLNSNGIQGVFEHHTGKLDQGQLEYLLSSLADNSLTDEFVYDNHGHGALVFSETKLVLDHPAWNVAVTGPRRSLMSQSKLRPYFTCPFGDMMMAGCFGLLAATADLMPEFQQPIEEAIRRNSTSKRAPWET